jgi:2-dehydro-3-deoxy-D-gluconate 5-dehydrogenase
MTLPEFSLHGNVAIVTGGGRGIGKACALSLAEAGADIVAVARSANEIEQTAREVRQLGKRCLAFPADVTRIDEIDKMVEQAILEFGRLDILVNVAGKGLIKPLVLHRDPEECHSGGTEWTRFFTESEWQDVMNTNLTSVFLCCQAVGPYMIRQKKGKVINVSSAAGAKGYPNITGYTSSKAAVTMFTRSLALEWAPYNVNVNAIGPGYVPTDFNKDLLAESEQRNRLMKSVPLKRFCTPREVGLLAVYLASSASDYITGQIIYIDGGLLA